MTSQSTVQVQVQAGRTLVQSGFSSLAPGEGEGSTYF